MLVALSLWTLWPLIVRTSRPSLRLTLLSLWGCKQLDVLHVDDYLAPVLSALLICPRVLFQTSGNRYLSAFGEVLVDALSLLAPEGTVEEMPLLLPRSILLLYRFVARNREACNRRTAVRIAQLRVAREPSDEDDLVDIRTHIFPSFFISR